jgi:hypothetical protein
MPSEKSPENTVIGEIRKGYMLGGRLLRPARVVISSGKAAEQQKPLEPDTEKKNAGKKAE